MHKRNVSGHVSFMHQKHMHMRSLIIAFASRLNIQ